MSQSLRVAACQIDTHVGNLPQNEAKITAAIAAAKAVGCRVAVLPELCVTGYPPEDLLLNESFVTASIESLERIASEVDGIVALVGCVERSEAGLHNSIAVLCDGRVQAYARKCRLPNYGVFDEQRYFSPGDSANLIDVNGVLIGLSVCEDIWFAGDPLEACVNSGAQLLINCSASPFHSGKGEERLAMLNARVSELRRAIVYCAASGAQDELVFDGQSMILAADGTLLARGLQFSDDLVYADVPIPARSSGTASLSPIASCTTSAVEATETEGLGAIKPTLSAAAELEGALVMGLRDYVRQNGFDGVLLGISGGIDSAVVATLAVDAVGADRVHAVVMPSPWSSTDTQQDARAICSNLGIERFEAPIEHLMQAYSDTLGALPSGPGDALADENVQARIRGNILMALSNRHGWLVLTTGNKSELAVGYSTLYGDAAGGFGVLKDVPKGTVYELAKLRNARSDAPIPQSIIDRAPSAELRPGQRDEDSLPPYPVLDEILRLYVERRLDREQIVAAGHDADTVQRVLVLVDRAEYKRRQYPPGIKITPLAFGRDRRMPITNGYRP